MRPYFKLPELISLANGFLAVTRDPAQKDFDHVIPRLNDQITRINSIMQYCPKLNDNYIVLYPQAIEIHKTLLEVIDSYSKAELNAMETCALYLALKPESGSDQWYNAGLLIFNILEGNANPTAEKRLLIERINMAIQLKRSLDHFNFANKIATLIDDSNTH